MAAPDPDEVPRLPRGRGIKLSRPEMFRIAMTLGLLIALIVLAKPCSDAVSKFVMRFDNGSNQGSQMPKPDKLVPPPPTEGVLIRGDMSEDERKAAIERARAAAAGSGSK